MKQVPEMSWLKALDPTHICKVLDEEAACWGKENGWIHSFYEGGPEPVDYYEEWLSCCGFEEIKGG